MTLLEETGFRDKQLRGTTPKLGGDVVPADRRLFKIVRENAFTAIASSGEPIKRKQRSISLP